MNQEMERQKSVELTKKLADMEGRRPRLYMADMEEDHSKEKRKLAATTCKCQVFLGNSFDCR